MGGGRRAKRDDRVAGDVALQCGGKIEPGELSRRQVARGFGERAARLEQGEEQVLRLREPLDDDAAVLATKDEQVVAALVEVDALIGIRAGLVGPPDVQYRICRHDQPCGRMQRKAKLAVKLRRHGGQRREIEGRRVACDARLVDGPFETRDVRQITELARRRIFA